MEKEPKNLSEFSDFEFITQISIWMDLPEYKIYILACNEVGITDSKEIDKSFERFYFSESKILLPEIRQELRKAFEILEKGGL